MAKRLGANSRKKQLERKAKMRKKVKSIFLRLFIFTIVSGTIVVCGIAGKSEFARLLNKFVESDCLSVKEINVAGIQNISEDQIVAGSGLKLGEKVYKFNKKILSENLVKNPWIEEVAVDRNLSGKISINIKERKPIALVNDGVIRQIDRNGVVLPFQVGTISFLPIVSGLKMQFNSSNNKVVVESDMKTLLKVLDQMKKSDFYTEISQIDLANKNKIKVKLQSHPTIIEMDTINIADRFVCLQALGDVLSADNAPERINLCYQNLAFVTGSYKELKGCQR
ncbi:MAG: FtsQ-type POTRA domain-containing protein [Fibrobacter sp.]|nr:FtsQ-type POTRA domain-containing protein [Fibrobacter sp.]